MGYPLVVWLRESYAPDQFDEYRRRTGMDADSVVADPRFADRDRRDFRLAPDSPVRSLSAQGGPVGALR